MNTYTELLIGVNLARIKAKISNPPVDPPPIKVMAHPAPTITPENIAAKSILTSLLVSNCKNGIHSTIFKEKCKNTG